MGIKVRGQEKKNKNKKQINHAVEEEKIVK